ncbi:MAG: FHA domain-containing protein, partial [bacterium]|nr:FHA domain-containing protein [bacterium]
MKNSDATDPNITNDSENSSPQEENLLDEKLLHEVKTIKEERKLFRERLAKAEENKKIVEESVYRKIKEEYQLKLEKSGGELARIKGSMDKALGALVKKKGTLERQIVAHRQKLEEAKFRNLIGELDEPSFKTIETGQKKEMEELGKEIQGYDAAIQQYETLFEGEELPLQSSLAKSMPESVIFPSSRPKTTPLSSRPKEVSDYFYAPEEAPFDETAGSSTQDLPTGGGTGKTDVSKESSLHHDPVLVQMEKEEEVQTFPIDETITIGRSPSSRVVLSESRVSRKHAVIELRGETYTLVDLDSSNGTFVKGKKIKEHPLQSGDEFKVGSARFIF